VTTAERFSSTFRNLSCVPRLDGLTIASIASGRGTQDRFLLD
jgi:hypothetical protein